jgi:hypothetical protein
MPLVEKLNLLFQIQDVIQVITQALYFMIPIILMPHGIVLAASGLSIFYPKVLHKFHVSSRVLDALLHHPPWPLLSTRQHLVHREQARRSASQQRELASAGGD